ncbi:hypothetical protein [Sphingomonas sp. PR090111-T3T-6A]|uniref:hypothetical protein n=1 Tax=Sphingomonas sp. PR090111-T3T-6A TaxID=685778 RepID=UPI0003716C6A|nr:hypothetical protein [Sphingomonas sp. PR090111-T3T-6A]
MPRRPLLLLLAAGLCGASAPADKAPARHFAAHCESATLPNFVVPLKRIAGRSSLDYGTSTPDASGTPTLATLARPGMRIETRFGQPRANDVDVTEYGSAPNHQDDVAFGRIVALFRFCEPVR